MHQLQLPAAAEKEIREKDIHLRCKVWKSKLFDFLREKAKYLLKNRYPRDQELLRMKVDHQSSIPYEIHIK